MDSLYGVSRDKQMLQQQKDQAKRSKNNANHYTQVGNTNVYKNVLGWTLTRVSQNGSIIYIGGNNEE